MITLGIEEEFAEQIAGMETVFYDFFVPFFIVLGVLAAISAILIWTLTAFYRKRDKERIGLRNEIKQLKETSETEESNDKGKEISL